MQPTRLILIGGFLGAGKTTLMSRLARQLTQQGKRVGLITNDQAADLVDSGILEQAGLHVEEIAGGCFCCRFGDLIKASSRLIAEVEPDVLIGEPVGSCTDISATVLQPLKALHSDRFKLAPFSVLVDPLRLREVLDPRIESALHPSARYILEETARGSRLHRHQQDRPAQGGSACRAAGIYTGAISEHTAGMHLRAHRPGGQRVAGSYRARRHHRQPDHERGL